MVRVLNFTKICWILTLAGTTANGKIKKRKNTIHGNLQWHFNNAVLCPMFKIQMEFGNVGFGFCGGRIDQTMFLSHFSVPTSTSDY